MAPVVVVAINCLPAIAPRDHMLGGAGKLDSDAAPFWTVQRSLSTVKNCFLTAIPYPLDRKRIQGS
jgi:hypothetical protein